MIYYWVVRRVGLSGDGISLMDPTSPHTSPWPLQQQQQPRKFDSELMPITGVRGISCAKTLVILRNSVLTKLAFVLNNKCFVGYG